MFLLRTVLAVYARLDVVDVVVAARRNPETKFRKSNAFAAPRARSRRDVEFLRRLCGAVVVCKASTAHFGSWIVLIGRTNPSPVLFFVRFGRRVVYGGRSGQFGGDPHLLVPSNVSKPEFFLEAMHLSDGNR